MSYYVYAHRKLKSGLVFYVGKGSGDRAWQIKNRSLFWRRTAFKYGFAVEIINQNLSEQAAFELEIEMISKFRKLKQCKCNISDGGDGVKVTHRWWGGKISKSLTGLPKPKGSENKNYKQFSSKEELRELYSKHGTPFLAEKFNVSTTTVWQRLKELGIPIRQVGSQRRKVICHQDGLVFDSIKNAAKYYGVHGPNINKVINGKYKHVSGRTFSYHENI